jgi:hypothetical protein
MEFETKKQRNNYFRSVNTIINDGPAARLEWAKVSITFTEEDFRLKSAIHNDAMVIEVNIVLTVKIRQPSHEFTFGVGMSFIPYPLVLTPVV